MSQAQRGRRLPKKYPPRRLVLEILERRDVPSFVFAPSYSVGTDPFHQAVGDINGDGALDIAVLGESLSGNPATITLLFGNGDGTFATGAIMPVTDYVAIATADVTGDGKLDLVANNAPLVAVDVLAGNGDGTFLSPVSYPSNLSVISYGLAAADFNGDARIDVAFSHFNGQGISVLINNGGGGFQPPVDHVGSQIFDLKTADINGDGAIDIVGIGYEDLAVLLGNGDGTFQSAIYNTDHVHNSLALADLNADGNLDVAAAINDGPQDVLILFGNGNGTFGNSIKYPAGFDDPDTVVAADFDGDGDVDLAMNSFGTISGDVTVTVFRNQNVSFRRRVAYVAGGPITHMVTADFNADNRTDIAATSTRDEVTIFLADPAATLKGASAINVLSPPEAAEAADLTGDTDLDLVVDPFQILAGAGGANFKVHVAYATNLYFGSGSITDVLVPDVDGDGDKDPVLKHNNTGPYPLSLWTNQGNLSFPTATSYALGTNSSPEFGTVGDVDGDADLDMITVTAGKVYVSKGNGDGTLQTAPTSFVTGSQPTGVITAQINADGLLDIIVTNRMSSGTISVHLGTGGGGFGPPANFSVGSLPIGVRVADLDGDGDSDVAVANSGSNDVSILLGNNDGTFAPVLNAGVGGTSPRNLAIGDFNLDGRLDLVTANSGSNNLSILFGNGDGTFTPPAIYATSATPKEIDVADLNGDGLVDLAVVSGLDAATDILRGNGDGTFQTKTSIPGPSDGYNLEIGDFNADGIPDIAVAYPSASVGLYRGNGDGTFAPLSPYVGGSSPVDIAAGDMNNDGILDLAVTNVLAPSVRILPGSESGFAAIRLINIVTPTSVRFTDMNGDTAVDLVTTANDGLRVRPNDGSGTFIPFFFYPLAGAGAFDVGDFNGDTIPDLIVAHSPDINGDSVSIMLGDGGGTFQAPIGIVAGSTPGRILAADFDNDGRLDFAASVLSTSQFTVALGNGDGSFAVGNEPIIGSKTALVVADFNQDGIADIAATAFTGGSVVAITLGNGDGTFQGALSYGAGVKALDVGAGDFDQDGWLDIFVVDNGSSSGAPKVIILVNAADWPPLPISDGSRPTAPLDDVNPNLPSRPSTAQRNISGGEAMKPAEDNATLTARPAPRSRHVARVTRGGTPPELALDSLSTKLN